MAKALQGIGTAIAFVGAVALTGGAALMGGFAGATTLFGISAQTLVGVGSLVSSIGGALSQPKVGAGGSPSTWTADPNAPLHFAAGRIGVAGQIVYRAAYGPNDRMYQSLISVVSAAGPIDGWESFKADDIAVTFDGSGKANSSYYANVMWRQTRLGAQPDTALTSPSGLEGGATLPSWGSSYKLSGKASYILTLAENSKRSAYQGREPEPLNVIRGLKVYDPRLDSTYPGGSGTHRLNNPATWTYSTNPILWGLKWSLGLWEDTTGKGAPQVGQQVGGIGAPIGSIDVASFIEAANIADANGWTTAAWPSTDDDKAQVLDAFLQAGGAYYVERAGKIACLHRAAPRASVATISAQDTAGPLEIDTTASRIQRKNAIVPSIWSEADGWQITAIEEVTAPEWVAEDGNRKRSEGVTFPYVTDASQAAQLACLQIAHTREGISGRIPLKPYMQGIEPGDCFTITEPGFVLDGLKCLCLETSYDAATGVHTVTFVSETDGKYPYALGQTQTPPGPPALEAVDPTFVTPPGTADWTIITPTPPADGAQYPVIDLSGFVSNDTADSMLIYWREVAEGEDPAVEPLFFDPVPTTQEIAPGWVDAGLWPPTTKHLSVTGIRSGATVWLAVRYRRGSNVSLPKLIGPITVQALTATVDPEVIQAQIDAATAALAAAQAALDAALAGLQQQVEVANGDFDTRLDVLDTGLSGVQAVNASQQTLIDGKASTSALNVQINRIDNVTGTVGTLQTTVANFPGQYVSTTAYNTLASEVANARGGYGNLSGRFTAQQQAITDGLAGKANASDLSSLQAAVSLNGSNIVALADRATAVESALPGKASASDLSTLQGTVSGQGTTLTAHNNRLNSIEVALPGLASASSVSNLSVVVSSKSTTYRQPSDPTNPNVGDILYKTSDNNRPFRYGGAGVGWVAVADERVAGLQGSVTTISGQIGTLQTVTADLQSGKASVQSVTDATAIANGASSNAVSALSLAASADGKASALVANQTDVNGVITGTYSYNNGVTTGFRVRSDLVEFVPSSNSGNRIEMSNGNIRVHRANNTLAFRAGVW